MSYNKIDYTGKNVVVTGAASGMGKAVKDLIGELGANIYAYDRNPVEGNIKKWIKIDQGDKVSLDAAAAQLPDRIDAVFHCSGVAGTVYAGATFTPLDVVRINYIGSRYIVESIIPKMPENSAITMISSIAGMGWRSHIADYAEFVRINDWDETLRYAVEREDDANFYAGPEGSNRAYTFAKECMNIYMTDRSWELSGKRIRINTISPGAVSTPMHDDFNQLVGKKRGTTMPISLCGAEGTGEEMASVMLFLNSDMAAYVSGVDIPVDYGMLAGITMKSAAPSPVMNAQK